MHEEDFETSVKIIVVGNGGVGKTSMIKRFCKGEWTEGYKKTIGVDFLEKEQFIKGVGESMKLMLWDTAGQEEFDAITRAYYRGAGACVLAFSTVDRQSFDDVENWRRKVEAEVGQIPMCLVQNKIDLIDSAVMTTEEAENLARKLNLRFYRTCVKDNVNVSEVFDYLATSNWKRQQQGSTTFSSPPSKIGKIGAPPNGSISTPISSTASISQPPPVSLSSTSTSAVLESAGATSSIAQPPESTEPAPTKKQPKQKIPAADAPFTLKPTIQRTKGKKKRFFTCTIL
mmetsp:Transcript_968/g.1484  ORF Transcript_968/g.1484 Transcript_968/m.1484 type:complete len:286 (-) Transcript_968:493-1350(-)|eukprot:CAMPEP_0184671462 /NCGR_PEP_ID=MMETSP0308-20130426/85513_1 /TAXON_ID=38269 /ORGANISM="Gloeochaete witrockiana, Strain SAG 46.84" /LENGTH=285 /DNA_ID=CAMNT_0027118595 /DNA_START=2449 /DNA_END=3306 /DNA_ORIENTATION=-